MFDSSVFDEFNPQIFLLFPKSLAPFGYKVFLKYFIDTLVSKNTEVLKNIKFLNLVNIVILETEVSSKTSFFSPH
jgi:hypothetical protein